MTLLLTPETAQFRETFGVAHALMNAPMADIAGPALAAAVSNAGGLGILAADFMTPEETAAAVKELRGLTDRPFAVNVRSPARGAFDEKGAAETEEALEALKADLGCAGVRFSLPDFEKQLDVLIALKVPAVSVTFGGIREVYAEKLTAAGIRMIAAATTLREVKVMRSAQAHCIVVQGIEAGGPRLNFEVADTEAQVGLMSLIGPAARVSNVPVAACGGIMTGRQAAAALMLGAGAVQAGTVFLAAPESGAHPAHKRALQFASDSTTRLTRVASGRLTRVIANGLIEAAEEARADRAAYPAQLSVMRPVEVAARRENRDDLMEFACGQGACEARALPAAKIAEKLIRECAEAGFDL